MSKKKICFIAQFPPPMHGLSKAVETLYNSELNTAVDSNGEFEFEKVDITNNKNFVKNLLKISRSKADLFYFTISQTRGGNLRDLVIFKLLELQHKPNIEVLQVCKRNRKKIETSFKQDNYLSSMRLQINEVVLFLAIVCFILGSTVIHFNDGVAINGVVQKMLYLLGTWFACKSMSYKEYKYCYENLTALLCVVAIIIQMLCILGGLPYHWTDINGRLFPLAVGHCVSWRNGNFYRLCGLYIEPGMFQIVINIALMYLIDDISKGDDKKEKRRKVLFFVVYIISVLMTMSTSGYIILIILMK